MAEQVDPYKKKEYQAFIKTISTGQAGHWVEIARAINVDQDTITKWKQLPEAQKAIQDGIDFALKQMEEAGGKDWKMWEAKLKMLGVNPTIKIDAQINDPRKEILIQYGLGTSAGADLSGADNSGGDSARQTPETPDRPSTNTA